MVPANEALNFIMEIIIGNGFQVDVEIGGYFTKMVSQYGPRWLHMAPKEDKMAPKEDKEGFQTQEFEVFSGRCIIRTPRGSPILTEVARAVSVMLHRGIVGATLVPL